MQVAHMVYFKLHDSSPAAREKLIADCYKYLTDHPGTVYLSVGTVGDDFTRPVNDRDFDVAFHIVFANRQAHDDYQAAPRHVEFVTTNKPTWKTIRVFDSYVS